MTNRPLNLDDKKEFVLYFRLINSYHGKTFGAAFLFYKFSIKCVSLSLTSKFHRDYNEPNERVNK